MSTIKSPFDILDESELPNCNNAKALLRNWDRWQRGISASGAAAAAYYAADNLTKDGFTQDEVADHFGVSESTIRQWYRHIYEANGGPFAANNRLENDDEGSSRTQPIGKCPGCGEPLRFDQCLNCGKRPEGDA